jgi:hypothetical protein
MSADPRRLHSTAIREAGHAVAFRRLLGGIFDASHVTIRPDYARGTAGIHASEDFEDILVDVPQEDTKSFAASQVTLLPAGYCAQLEAGDTHEAARPGASSDFDTAEELREGYALPDEATCLATARAFVREPRNWTAILAVVD